VRGVVLFWLIVASGLVWSSFGAGQEKAFSDESILKAAGLATDGPSLVSFLQSLTLSEKESDLFATLSRQLGDDSFEIRERASAELRAAGTRAMPILKKAARSSDVEIAHRATECLEFLSGKRDYRVEAAAVRRLRELRPAGAVEVILGYCPFVPHEIVAGEVLQAMESLCIHDGKPQTTVAKALKDRSPARRAVAAEVLSRLPNCERSAIRRLLQDPEPMVRLRVARALASAGEKEAVPVLITLVGELPASDRWQAEEILQRIAEDNSPPNRSEGLVAPGEQLRIAWNVWWRAHSRRVDWQGFVESGKVLDRTLLVEWDSSGKKGRVFEIDAAGKIQWQIGGLASPVDAHILKHGRVLIAEYTAMRVTERDFQGRIHWEQRAIAPVSCQRLPNGDTFIASRHQLREVRRDHGEIFSRSWPSHDLEAARRLPDGQIVCLASGGKCVKIDPQRGGFHAFATERTFMPSPLSDLSTTGTVDAQVSGQILIPHRNLNRVVEYGPGGEILWQMPIQRPASAIQLSNHKLLVTSQERRTVAEVNRDGKIVWEYHLEGIPLRARRR
jgi:hypothetical protein